jgi:WD40 repeat protein/serine/threonine protein kinase
MSASNSDRNLLFGILALQMDFISRDALIAAMHAWVLEKAKPLGQILLEQGHLDPEHLNLLEALVQAHIRGHRNDPQQSLASLSSVSSVRQELAGVADDELQASLSRVAGARDHAEVRSTGLSAMQMARIEELCDRFETAWKAAASIGQRPRMEDYVGEPAAPEHAILLCELAALDIAYRRLAREHPSVAEYRARFPNLDAARLARLLARQGSQESGATIDQYASRNASGLRYRILRPHARGGLGEVFVALDQELHREVALKEIKEERAHDSVSRSRFLLEAEITGGLEHPGIVPVYGLGQYADGRPFYAMRFIKGDNLKEAIRRFHEAETPGRDPGERSLALRDLLRRFVDVCNAVAYAHSRGVLHRDLKPGNIMLGKYGETLIVDWGLAKSVGRSDQTRTAEESTWQPSSGSDWAATVMGTVIGTPAYMSPEQAAGRLDLLGPASDIYSLGATLYALLTGTAPFDELDKGELLQQVQRGAWRPPRQVKPNTPLALDAICRKAMALRPEVRYATALALAADVEHCLADEPVTAYREPWMVLAARWGRRHKPVVAGTAGLLMAALAALAISTVLLRQEQRRTQEQRDQAVSKSQEATERAESLDRQLYINRVNLAYRECLANNIALAEQLLAGCPEPRRGWEWQYCRRLCHLESLSIGLDAGGHGQGHDLALTPDSTMIASANQDGTITLWDAATGRELRRIGARGAAVFSLAFSPDGATIASGSQDVVKLWETGTGRELRSLRGPAGRVVCVRFSPDGRRLAAGSRSSTIEEGRVGEGKLWEVATGQELGSFQARYMGSIELVFSPDGQQVATVTEWARTLSLHDAATGREIRTVDVGFGDGNYGIYGIAYAPDGRQVSLACRDGSVLFWDLAANALLRAGRGHSSTALAVAFSPDGRLVASGSSDGAIKLWDAATGREIANYRGHSAPVRRICFFSSGTRLASLGEDPAIKLWEVIAEPDVFTLRGHQGWAFRAVFSPDSRRLVTAGFNIVLVRDIGTGQTLTKMSFRGGGVQGLALSPDGKQVATSSEFAEHADLWDTETGRHLVTFRGHTGHLRGVAFSPDGQQVASASDDRTVRLWDAATGREVRVLRGHSQGVFGVAFSPVGLQLASIGWDGAVRLWEASTGQELRSFACVERAPSELFGNAVAFSPDGQRLAATANHRVLIWDLKSGREERTLTGHTRDVNGIAFSPDGRRLASAAEDTTLKLWDPTTGAEVFTLRGHTDGVLGVGFSPDGLRLASASQDMTVKVWEAVPPGSELLQRRRAISQADP